jgi:cell division protein ZapA
LPEIKKVAEMKSVSVNVFGDTYHLKTDDPEGLDQIVQMVNFHMQSVSKSSRIFSGTRIAVMAALKIAEDYMQLKKDYDELLTLLNENK